MYLNILVLMKGMDLATKSNLENIGAEGGQ